METRNTSYCGPTSSRILTLESLLQQKQPSVDNSMLDENMPSLLKAAKVTAKHFSVHVLGNWTIDILIFLHASHHQLKGLRTWGASVMTVTGALGDYYLVIDFEATDHTIMLPHVYSSLIIHDV